VSRIRQLDGIRGFAILLVLLSHYIPQSGDRGLAGPASIPALVWVRQLTALTWSGVDLFFVLSGFLIGGILIDERASDRYYRTFYARRACRILPLYAIFLVPYLIAHSLALWTHVSVSRLFLGSLPAWTYVVFLQNVAAGTHGSFGALWLAVTWSLAIEEQFYVVLPPVVRSVSGRWLPWLLFCGIALAPALRIHLLNAGGPHGPFLGYVLSPCRGDALLAGALAAYLVRRQSVLDGLRRRSRSLTTALLVLLAGYAWLTLEAPGFDSRSANVWGRTWLAALYVVMVVTAFVQDRGRMAAAFRNPALCWLGARSYALYLLHLPLLGLLHDHLLSPPTHPSDARSAVVSLLALATTLALAAVSYRWLERPFLEWGRAYSY